MSHLLRGLVLAILISGTASAKDPDFDCSFPIKSIDSALRRVELPEAVYQCFKQSNYQDMQIQNGNGDRVPLSIEHPMNNQQRFDFEKTLRFNRDRIEPIFNQNKKIRRLIEAHPEWMKSGNFEAWQQEHPVFDILTIENPEAEGRLNRITFELGAFANGPISATVVVEYSDDLIQWSTDSNPQKLFFLQNSEQGFDKTQLILRKGSRRYIRLLILSNAKEFVNAIEKLQGHYQRTQRRKPKYNWARPTVIQQLSDGQDWQYSVPSQLPVSQLRFVPNKSLVFFSGVLMQKPIENEVPDDNSYFGLREGARDKLKRAVANVVKGKRRSHRSINHGWNRVKRFHQYHDVDSNSSSFESEPIYFGHHTSRHWRVKYSHPSAAMIAADFPVVEFGWASAKVKFLAQGPEPFVLLAGSEQRVSNVSLPYQLLKREQAGETTFEPSLGGWEDPLMQIGTQIEQRSKALDSKEVDFWSTSKLIWLVLILGVAFMLFMAKQLLAEIKLKSEKKPDPPNSD